LVLFVAFAAAAPFIVWDPAVFIGNTVYFELGRPVQ
jgi:hypothetical protein